jgi:hypothetical protein
MNQHSLKYFSIIVLIVLSSLTFNCGLSDTEEGDDDDDAISTELEEALEVAKVLLAQGLYSDAKNAFYDILAQLDEEYRPAKFGWAISRTLELLFDLAEESVALVSAVEDFSDLFRTSTVVGKSGFAGLEMQPQQGTGIMGTLVDGVLDLLDKSLEEIDGMLEAVIEDEEFYFFIETLPVKIEIFEVLDMGGEFDRSDALLFSGVAKFMRGCLSLLYAYNYDIDLFDTMPSIGMLFEDDSMVATTGNVINLVAYIFHTNTDLLNLDDDGVEMLEQSRQLMAAGANRVVEAMDSAMAETDDQQDDILAVDQAAVPPMIVANITLSNDLLDHSTYSDGRMMIANLGELQTATARFSENLISGGPRLTFAEDVAPVFGFIMVILFDSGLLGVIADYIVAEVDSGFADYIFGSTEGEETSENDVIDFLNHFIPNYLEIDFGGFFDYAGNIRDILPPTIIMDGIDDDPSLVFSSLFLHEWECNSNEAYAGDSSLMPGLLCPAGADALNDVGHFPPSDDSVATDYYYRRPTNEHVAALNEFEIPYIPPDGLKSPLPYFPLTDPTFNHLVWVNIDEITPRVAADDSYSGFMMADLYSVSKAFANLSENFVAIILDQDLDEAMNK